MDLPPEAEDYIRASIESSLDLPVSAKTLRLKLLASEDARRLLQDQLFVLQERLDDAGRRLDQSRAEGTMSAQGLRRCVEGNELLASEFTDLKGRCAEVEKECALYERDIERIMESYDELAKENEELRASLLDKSSITSLVADIESLERDKENLRINLQKAEEEVNILHEENNFYEQENRRLLRQLHREKHNVESDNKHSTSGSAKGKRKSHVKESSPAESTINFNREDSLRLT